MKNATVLAMIFVCIGVACSSKKDPKKNIPGTPNRQMPANVEGYVVKTSTISNSIEVPGSLMPFESTELHPEVSGRVVSMNIKEGGQVKKGTLLVKLFDSDLQAQLKKLQVQLSISEKTVQRQGELLKISGISQQEYDLSGLDVNNIRADIDVIQTAISKTQIRAPFDGRLGLRNISLGAYVTPATIVTTIQQVEQLKLEFTVPEKYSNAISIGQLISFSTEGSSKKFKARLIATESAVTEESRSLRIRAVVSGSDRSLIPGTFAKVSLDFGDDNKALLVPTQAILPGARNKQVILYRGGIAKFAVVGTGIRDSARVQITNGLAAGDTIVITGILSVKPESKINLTKIATEETLTPVTDSTDSAR